MKADRIITRETTIGSCPSCESEVIAKATISVAIGAPVMGDDGSVTVPTTSTVTRIVVRHACEGDASRPEPAPKPEVVEP